MPAPQMPPMSPESLLGLMMSFTPYFTLRTGLELDVFTKLVDGPMQALQVAEKCSASARGMAMLLDALAGLDLLSKGPGGYSLTPVSKQCLVKTSPDYMGLMLGSDRMVQSWAGLTQAVRTGSPVVRVEDQQAAEQFFPMLISGLHVAHLRQSKVLAERVGAGVKGLRVLDIACGSGVWGIPFAEADPTARVTAQDYPGVLEHTRRYVAGRGVSSQFDYLPGRLDSINFADGAYDIAILGHIVHSEGEALSRQLFRRLHAALKPGGRVVVLDMIPNDARTGPPFPLLFALNMLLHTGDGGTYTLSEYTAWFKEAGFASVAAHDIQTHSPAIVATK